MSDFNIDLARKDELPETFTSSEIADIKAAIDIPRANVYVKPYEIYSPNEQVVGEWQEMVDGVLKKKPLYQKYIRWNPPLVSNSSLDIESLKIDKGMICYAEGNGENGAVTPLNYYEDSTWWATIYMDNGSTNHISRFVFWGGSNFISHRSTNGLTITIQYTKTTDSWEVVE